MNRKNLFIGLCFSFSAIFCGEVAQEPRPEYCYTSPELVNNIKAICQNEYGNQYDDCIIFIKNGVINLGSVREWYIKDENRSKKLDEACSYFFDQCVLGNLICSNMSIQCPAPLQEISIRGEFLIAGTNDCRVCNPIKKYLEENVKLNGGILALPEINMNDKDVVSNAMCVMQIEKKEQPYALNKGFNTVLCSDYDITIQDIVSNNSKLKKYECADLGEIIVVTIIQESDDTINVVGVRLGGMEEYERTSEHGSQIVPVIKRDILNNEGIVFPEKILNSAGTKLLPVIILRFNKEKIEDSKKALEFFLENYYAGKLKKL